MKMLGTPIYSMLAHIAFFGIILLLKEYTPEIKGFFLRIKRNKGNAHLSTTTNNFKSTKMLS